MASGPGPLLDAAIARVDTTRPRRPGGDDRGGGTAGADQPGRDAYDPITADAMTCSKEQNTPTHNSSRGLKERPSPHSLASPGTVTCADVPTRALVHRRSTLFRVTIDVTLVRHQACATDLRAEFTSREVVSEPIVVVSREVKRPPRDLV